MSRCAIPVWCHVATSVMLGWEEDQQEMPSQSPLPWIALQMRAERAMMDSRSVTVRAAPVEGKSSHLLIESSGCGPRR